MSGGTFSGTVQGLGGTSGGTGERGQATSSNPSGSGISEWGLIRIAVFALVGGSILVGVAKALSSGSGAAPQATPPTVTPSPVTQSPPQAPPIAPSQPQSEYEKLFKEGVERAHATDRFAQGQQQMWQYEPPKRELDLIQKAYRLGESIPIPVVHDVFTVGRSGAELVLGENLYESDWRGLPLEKARSKALHEFLGGSLGLIGAKGMAVDLVYDAYLIPKAGVKYWVNRNAYKYTSEVARVPEFCKNLFDLLGTQTGGTL